MTSKIIVNNIESDSGVSSVTFTSDIELGTKNLKGHNLESTGIVTAVSFTGSGANLTNLPAANITGTLPALDGSALTGVGASFGNSSVNTSGIITATSFVQTTGQLSHRNLIINGAMMVSQRATSATGTSGYGSVDRFSSTFGGHNEAPTQAQVDVASGTTPYSLGFRKAFKITNGNQTSIDATDYINFHTKLEGQTVSQSGWNYLSTSSFITLSFWVKSSVAQNFYGYIDVRSGTRHLYSFETGALTADTWTKITKTIPGNSNLQFDPDNQWGLMFIVWPYLGTSFTNVGATLNTWRIYGGGGQRVPPVPTTWWTTNDATIEFTGVQLEVGPVATPFEFRSYGDELARCQRYFIKMSGGNFLFPQNNVYASFSFPQEMRDAPTLTFLSGAGTKSGIRVEKDGFRAVNSLGPQDHAFTAESEI